MFHAPSATVTLVSRSSEPRPLRLMLHGLAVQLHLRDERLEEAVRGWLNGFIVDAFPGRIAPAITGEVGRYDVDEICRLLPQKPEPIDTDALTEIYREPDRPERIWLIDEQWGIATLDLLKGKFRAWVVPAATMEDPLSVAEAAVMWPMAQLARARGPMLLPGVAISNDDSETAAGVLLLSPFSLEPDLTALLADGWRLLGQRWAAVQVGGHGLQLLRMPGWVEHRPPPVRGAGMTMRQPERINLDVEFRSAVRHVAPLRGVAVIEPGRRSSTTLTALDPAAAASLLRSAWPLAELTTRRMGGPALLAKHGNVVSVCLGRDPRELSRHLASWLGPATMRIAA